MKVSTDLPLLFKANLLKLWGDAVCAALYTSYSTMGFLQPTVRGSCHPIPNKGTAACGSAPYTVVLWSMAGKANTQLSLLKG